MILNVVGQFGFSSSVYVENGVRGYKEGESPPETKVWTVPALPIHMYPQV